MEGGQPSLYDHLVGRGVSRQEIDRIYLRLRERGYGDQEARRRSQEALARARAERDLEERRRGGAPAARQQVCRPRNGVASTSSGQPALGAAPGAARLPGERDAMRRAGDWAPSVPAGLRRRINAWAYRHGYLVTRLHERIDDLISYVDPRRKDFVSRPFLQAIAGRLAPGNPFSFSFVETLEALAETARVLLGWRDARSLANRQKARQLQQEVRVSLQAREPFVAVFLDEFIEPREMLSSSFEYLEAALKTRRRVEVGELARVIRDGYRLILVTSGIGAAQSGAPGPLPSASPGPLPSGAPGPPQSAVRGALPFASPGQGKLDQILAIAREANLSHEGDGGASPALEEASAVFRAAFLNLPRFAHELYPVVLKMMASFYEEGSSEPEKQQRILTLLELRENEILTWEGWHRQEAERRERALAEQRQREVERLEVEKAESMGQRFEGTLAALGALFPGSAIERMEQGAFVMPYFANRVYLRSPLVRSRQQDLELVASSDAMGMVMVLHEILGDLLSSLDPWPLASLVPRGDLAERFATLREEWEAADTYVFGPYLDELRDWSRELGTDPRTAARFRGSARARSIEERANHIRGRAIRNWGHVVSGRRPAEGWRLHEAAARLAQALDEIHEVLSADLMGKGDSVSRRLVGQLAQVRMVDFAARSRTDSPDYRPMIRQIRRWIEARHGVPAESIPAVGQLEYLEVFRGLAELYAYLLNEKGSFVSRSSHALFVAGEEERELWRQEREERGRDALALLEERLKEQVAARYVDSLTGLRNKEFFLAELPARLDRLRSRKRPVAFLMMDIDHFKWVNDELGHQAGDETLAETARMVLDNVREGDLAIRYGGEEFLLVVPGTLHTGVMLAERMRFLQERRIATREGLARLRGISAARGESCGTLSVGVAEAHGSLDAAGVIERADRALYAAKRRRNCVVLLDHERRQELESYDDYRSRLGLRNGQPASSGAEESPDR